MNCYDVIKELFDSGYTRDAVWELVKANVCDGTFSKTLTTLRREGYSIPMNRIDSTNDWKHELADHLAEIEKLAIDGKCVREIGSKTGVSSVYVFYVLRSMLVANRTFPLADRAVKLKDAGKTVQSIAKTLEGVEKVGKQSIAFFTFIIMLDVIRKDATYNRWKLADKLRVTRTMIATQEKEIYRLKPELWWEDDPELDADLASDEDESEEPHDHVPLAGKSRAIKASEASEATVLTDDEQKLLNQIRAEAVA